MSREAGDKRTAEMVEKESRAADEEKQGEAYNTRKEEKLEKVQRWNEQRQWRRRRRRRRRPLLSHYGGRHLVLTFVSEHFSRTATIAGEDHGGEHGVGPGRREVFRPPGVERLPEQPRHTKSPRFLQVVAAADLWQGDPASPLPKDGVRPGGATPLSSLPGSPLASPKVRYHKRARAAALRGLSVDSFDSVSQDVPKRKMPVWAQAAPQVHGGDVVLVSPCPSTRSVA